MANPAQDHDFGAIEAAVRETARGRAFLADYAKKVRQSDILTLLAMMRRLERWCEEQSARIGDIEKRGAHQPGESVESAELARPQERQSAASTGLVVAVDTVRSTWHAEPVGDLADAAGDPDRDLAGRVQNLATAIGELGRRVADVANDGRALQLRSDQQDEMSDDDVLGDIAKALGPAS